MGSAVPQQLLLSHCLLQAPTVQLFPPTQATACGEHPLSMSIYPQKTFNPPSGLQLEPYTHTGTFPSDLFTMSCVLMGPDGSCSSVSGSHCLLQPASLPRPLRNYIPPTLK